MDSREQRTKVFYFSLIKSTFSRNMKNISEFRKALMTIRKEYLAKTFLIWKERTQRKKIPLRFQEKKHQERKRKIFKFWISYRKEKA